MSKDVYAPHHLHVAPGLDSPFGLFTGDPNRAGTCSCYRDNFCAPNTPSNC